MVGIGVMTFGVLYWAFWRVILPKTFKYKLVPTKENLSDGTVVTVVRNLFTFYNYTSWRLTTYIHPVSS